MNIRGCQQSGGGAFVRVDNVRGRWSQLNSLTKNVNKRSYLAKTRVTQSTNDTENVCRVFQIKAFRLAPQIGGLLVIIGDVRQRLQK